MQLRHCHQIINNKKIHKILMIFSVLLIIKCSAEPKPQLKGGKQLISPCYIMKPVYHDSKADSLRNFDFPLQPLEDLIGKIESGNTDLSFDSAMDYITSFERQKILFINSSCFKI
jgi:hypothetical protein